MPIKRIALFGLSGNPPTGDNGHRGIIKHIKSLKQFNEIIILPVYIHMYINKSNLLDYNHRYNMCKLNFIDLNDSNDCIISISQLEKQLYELNNNNRIGTIDIINYVINECNTNQYHLIIGLDTFADIMKGKWKQSDKIVDLVTFEVFIRPGIQLDINDIINNTTTYLLISKAKYTIHNISNLTSISSTTIRNYNIDTNILTSNPYNSLHRPVLDYIKDNELYSYSFDGKND